MISVTAENVVPVPKTEIYLFAEGERELSSDDEDYAAVEGNCCHLDDDSDCECNQGLKLDQRDVNRFGTRYAKYKARLRKEEKDQLLNFGSSVLDDSDSS